MLNSRDLTDIATGMLAEVHHTEGTDENGAEGPVPVREAVDREAAARALSSANHLIRIAQAEG